jgi:ParB family chromosome partitioning protein
MLPLSALQESPLNPRQHFDATALHELTESIKTKGVLVPLLVRPVNGHFEIVAGARRYRAAQAAALTDVPTLVRELDDLQALEAATIENLQRADVHPLDEALGYQALMTRAHYEPETIAAKVGKSISYVYQRLQLLKLIEPLRTLFLEDEMTAGHAVELARLTATDQEQLLNEGHSESLFEYSWDGKRNQRVGVINVRALRHLIQRTFHLDLARAPWRLEDADLVDSAGSCVACPKRAGANPALFPDIEKANTCTDPTCYALKQHRTAEQKQAQLAAKGEKTVLISEADAYSGNDAKRLAAAGILPHNEYSTSRADTGWRDAGKQKCPHLAKGIVADGREIGTVKVVCTAPGSCPVHAKRLNEHTGSAQSSAAYKKQQREQKIRAATRRQTLEAIVSKVSVPMAVDDLRAVILQIFTRLYNPQDRDLVKALGWLPEAKKGKRPDHDKAFRANVAGLADGAALWRLAIRTMLWPDAQVGPDYGAQGGGRLEEFAKRYKVDAAAIERGVRAEEKAKAAEKGKKAKSRAAKPTPLAKAAARTKRGTCRVCGCTDDHACPNGCFWLDQSETLCSTCGTVDADGRAVEKSSTPAKKPATKKAGKKR